MSEITLTIKNESNLALNNDIVIFTKNEANTVRDFETAWTVVHNLPQGWTHQFEYPMTMQVGASDAYGNSLGAPSYAENGQAFAIKKSRSGDELVLSTSPASDPKQVEVRNSLSVGSINAEIYKNGKLLAVKSGVGPEQKANFEFKPSIWIGVASEVEEGQVINSAVMSAVNTELSLLGIKSADIVMTGGGTGRNATAVEFKLENVVGK